MTNKHPLVSVILSTRNEEKNIKNFCISIKQQIYPNIELIIVDNFSTDATLSIAKRYVNKVYSKGPERSMQRNFGVEKAIGEYVLILDADMRLDEQVVVDCVELITSDSKVGAIIIPEKAYGENFWSRCRAFEKEFYEGDDTIEAARFFPKSVFVELGGFDSKMVSGEDWYLTKKVRAQGYAVKRIKSYIHHYEGKLSYLGSIKKKYYYAKKADQYIEKGVGGPLDILKFVFRPAYFRHWKKLLSRPHYSFGFMFLKFSEIFVGGFFAIVLTKTFWKKVFTFRNVSKP